VSENGSGKKSIVGEVLELLDDQLELASLEWQYEKTNSLKRILAIVSGAMFAVSAFALLLVAAVLGLTGLGLSLIQSCLVLAVILGGFSAVLILRFSRRDPKVGAPFQGTRQEARKNLKWMRQLFS
jgi:uncharacterized membrane protein YqjE